MQKVLLSFFVVLCFSVVVGAVLFLGQAPENQVSAAPTSAICQTGFSRPLLFGVNPPSGSGSVYDKTSTKATIVNSGSTVAKVSLNWDHSSIQGNGPDDYNPESVNFPIRKAYETGRVVVVNLSGTPNWASGNPGMAPGKAQPDKNNAVVNREFKELVSQAVRDNKDKVKYWTYWNEPNGCMSSTGSCGYTNDSLKDFVYWHKVFYETVKAEDPSAQVIFGNLDFTGPNVNFIKDAHKLDVKYDYLGLNVYKKEKNAKLPIEWAKAGYDAQPANYRKPIWLNEWGFDSIWWGCSGNNNTKECRDRARQEMLPLIDDALDKITAADYIFSAQYHNLRDEGGAYGLWDSDSIRVTGTRFLEQVKNRCDPRYTTEAESSGNPPANTDKTNITVRTYYEASSLGDNPADPATWPSVSLFANNMAGVNAGSPPTDTIPCDGSVTDTRSKCGSLNLFKEKLIANYQVTGSSFTTDHVIPTSKLFDFSGENLGVTKLSYVFYNDAASSTQDRNVAIKRIEFYGFDGKLFLTYEADGSEKGYKVTPPPANNRALESLYFDMGFVNNTGEKVTSGSNAQDGMIGAFDKKELNQISAKSTKWALNQEGSFNLLTLAAYSEWIRNYPDINAAQCVVATNNLGGNKLTAGQSLTLTSVASAPVKTFKYSFYVPGTGGTPTKPFCVAGSQYSSADCPAGTGQLVIESNGANQGVVQAVDWMKLPNGNVVQSFWKGNIGSNRQIPFDSDFGQASVAWNFSNYVSALNIGGPFKPMAEIDALATYATNNQTATMEIWRNNQLWYNIVPFTSNGNNLDWGRAQGWKMYNDFNAKPTEWPGSGLVIARSSFVGKDNKLWHIYWRGNEEWARGVPIVNGNPNSSLLDKEPNKGWIKTRTLSELESKIRSVGTVQGLAHIVTSDSTVEEQIWVGGKAWKRVIPMSGNGPDFTSSNYSAVVSPAVPLNEKTGSETIAYNKIHLQDANLKKIPENLQVNATFVTDAGATIGDNAACTTWFSFDNSMPGDANKNCLIDIYDYTALMQHYGENNCSYNLVGDCTIDNLDVQELIKQYGNTCQ